MYFTSPSTAILCHRCRCVHAVARSALAQETRATLNGHVEDAEHAAIPHATVTAQNTATGVDTAVEVRR